MKKTTAKLQKIRLAIQSLFIMISIYLFIMLISGKYLSAHAFCPYAPICFGLARFSFAHQMLILYSGAVLFGLLVSISTMFWGRKFCGYICPFGTLQEFIFKLRKKKYRLTKRVPFFYEYKFRRIKYLVFAITVALIALGRNYIYMKFCPVLTTAGLPRIIWQGGLVLFIIIGAGFLIERFWCRYFCPMAALMNLFQYMGNLFGFKKKIIIRNMESCIDCCLCNKNCTMNIDIQNQEYITDVNCIHCLKCLANCPKKGTLKEVNVKRDCYE